ncbi:MAG: glycosyltransferase [Candidatus Omnitrophica bacterium]|nr:glycosyltransferase [Candidatus Omnitrophota bacterium]MDD5553263.1 glycosyltransferase [Candidatus Omnitrophota bacterium]
MDPFVSIIIPVKNEAGILSRCLESLRNLDYLKERMEVIICDGLSTDKTREIALSYGARVVRNDKQVVVSGRNRGFEAAKGSVIAFTDADCVFDRGWIRNSVKYLEDKAIGGVGGRTLAPETASGFEKAVDLIFSLADVFQATCHRKGSHAACEVKDIPGCNAVYRKDALDKVMPVDETLLTAEDVWMNSCVRKNGYRLISAPDAILWHNRRSSPKKFSRQVYRFAIGRLQAGKRRPELLNPFHILSGLCIPFLLAAAIYAFISGSHGTMLLSALILAFAAFLASMAATRSFAAAVNLPLAAIIFSLAWSAGFLRELFFPMKDIKGR